MNHIGRYNGEHFGTQPTQASNENRNKYVFLFSSVTEKDIKIIMSFCDIKEESNELKIQPYNLESKTSMVSFYHTEDKVNVEKMIDQKLKENGYENVKWFEFKLTDERNVYVKHLSLDLTEQDLRDIFSKYGAIISIKLIRKESNMNKIAFVRFQNKQDAKKAIDGVNNSKIKKMGPNYPPICCDLSRANQQATRLNNNSQAQSFVTNNNNPHDNIYAANHFNNQYVIQPINVPPISFQQPVLENSMQNLTINSNPINQYYHINQAPLFYQNQWPEPNPTQQMMQNDPRYQ